MPKPGITPPAEALLALNHALEVYNVERGNTKLTLTTGDKHNDYYLVDILRMGCDQFNLLQTAKFVRADWPALFTVLDMEIRIGK